MAAIPLYGTADLPVFVHERANGVMHVRDGRHRICVAQRLGIPLLAMMERDLSIDFETARSTPRISTTESDGPSGDPST